MIRLDRRDLIDLAGIVLLANTPYSLFHALLKTSAVFRLKQECEPVDLEQYYDRITVRARRTEIELGIAYAVLIALLTIDKVHNPIDASRLQWGVAIEELVQKSGRTTQSIRIQSAIPQPMVQQRQSPGGTGLIIHSSR
jgi:hypothetical protein